MEDMNEQVSVRLPRGLWNSIIAVVWKNATCEVGNPIIEALRQQLDSKPVARNGAVVVDE
jgi:hypothetical protein